MKKIKKIFIFVLCIMSLFLVTGCEKKEAVSSDTFKSTAEELGYTVRDTLGQYDSFSYVKAAYFAVDNNSSIGVEFIELEDDNNAKNFYEANKANVENYIEDSSANVSIDLVNYQKIAVESDSYYKVIIRVGKTILYSDTSKDNKDEVKELVEKLGY